MTVQRIQDVDINLGMSDRTVRVVIGIAMLGIVSYRAETLWALIGLLPLMTGIAGYCPLYRLFDFSTVGWPHRERHA